MSSAPALRVRATDPAYQRLARAEAAHWAHPPVGSLESLERLQSDGPVDRYQNRRFTVRPGVPWQDTIRDYGVFRRGIVLGTSSLDLEARVLETNPTLHLTFLDLSAEAVRRREELLGARYPGRVTTMVADLNFVELATGSYDLVLSSASMHHVTNLENVAYQIDRALTSDGHFFLQDYVGEPRFQFCAEKKRLFEFLHDRQAQRDGRRPGLVWLDITDLSPFCGVRSDEVLNVLGRYLEPVLVRTAGSLVVPLLRARALHGEAPDPPSRPRRLVEWFDTSMRALRGRPPRARAGVPRRFLRELMEIGDLLSDAALLPPGNAFAVYRKRRE